MNILDENGESYFVTAFDHSTQEQGTATSKDAFTGGDINASLTQEVVELRIGMDTCYTCWLEECLTTNCLGCKRGNYPDCKWIDLKKSYQEEDK